MEEAGWNLDLRHGSNEFPINLTVDVGISLSSLATLANLVIKHGVVSCSVPIAELFF